MLFEHSEVRRLLAREHSVRLAEVARASRHRVRHRPRREGAVARLPVRPAARAGRSPADAA